LLEYRETPIQTFDHPSCKHAGVQLLIKREDLNHSAVSGNKWWKLKYNLEVAESSGQEKILTFGGAYSNHIYATAAATKLLSLSSVGIIRGEQTLPLNPTLQFAKDQGMNIHYVSRTEYRNKETPEFINMLKDKFGDFFLIPEGGSNALAVKGCAEFAEQQLAHIDFDHLLMAVGTGGTIAGIITGLGGNKSIIGVPVLKNATFLKDDIARLIHAFSGKSFPNWSLLTGYDEGGYAKHTLRLRTFIAEVMRTHGIPLDHVYTGKLFFALIREIEAGAFRRGSTILALHTGGMQGLLPELRPDR
jgi:1-aminocyclopropane-1-carboxylate deaminase